MRLAGKVVLLTGAAGVIIAGPRGIRVNTIHPGFVDSRMVDRLAARHGDPAAFRKTLEAKALPGRLTRPEEIADAALFPASDESRAVTNTWLVVDCGTLD